MHLQLFETSVSTTGKKKEDVLVCPTKFNKQISINCIK